MTIHLMSKVWPRCEISSLKDMKATMEPPKLRIDDGCLCTVTVDSKRFHEGLSKIVVTSCETLLRGVKLTMF